MSVFLICSTSAGRWFMTEPLSADSERMALDCLADEGHCAAYEATTEEMDKVMGQAWSLRIHPSHVANEMGLTELELGNVIG